MMKKVILTIAILVSPFLMTAQNSDENAKVEINTTVKTEVAAKKKTEPISINPLEQTNMNIKKSHDIISVEAYIKSLQIKGKTTLNS